MERAIKERLIGAALLVLAGVIIIPWLLDGKTSKPTTQRELLLPGSASNENETRVVSLDLPQKSKPTPAPVKSMKLDSRQVKEAGDPSAMAPSTQTGAQRDGTSDDPTSVASAPMPSSVQTKVPSTQKEPGQNESSGAKSKPALVAQIDPDPPATFSEPLKDSGAKTTPTATKPVADASQPSPTSQATSNAGAQQWAVQVGSFASQENAERLAERLRGKNYAAFVMRNVIEGRVRFRVRVGPVDERAQADLLAAALKEDRQPAKVLSHP